MPVTYTRDNASRRVHVRASGQFDADEIIQVIHRQRDEGTWHYALLFDARMMRGDATFDDLYRIRAANIENSKPRGPLAIVLNDAALYRKACAYAMLVAPQRRIEVFDDLSDADRWLRELGF